MTVARQKCITPWIRRLRYFGSRLFGTRLQKSQKVYLVEIGGQRFKRIVLHDAFLASRMAGNLEAFGPTPYLPRLVICYEQEVWVDYVAGRTVNAVDADFISQLAGLYGHLYARAPQQIAVPGSVWADRIDRDLDFLQRVGIIDGRLHAALMRRLPDMLPVQAWTGYDYTDPVLKNFVRSTNGQLVAIDVESLEAGQLLGLGVAKACARWMGPYRETFFTALRQTQALDILPYFEFVELVFAASYAKLMYLERKWKRIDVRQFERFCAAHEP
ncbi:MAG: hypothetical protein WD928_01820 [Gammaproteobacteria bacterium]